MNFDLGEAYSLFRDTVRNWANNACPKDWCRELERQEHQYPQALWDKLSEAGFNGIGIDEEYGGLGGDIIAQALFMREFARNAAGLCWIWGVTSFSGSKSVGYYGTDEQKQRFLPAMARGEIRTAMAFTEPAGGTDLLGALRTTATRSGDGWLINGEKVWSTTADTADYLLVIARTSPPSERRTDGVSIFLVPRETEGVTITPLPKLGMRCLSSCQVQFDNALVSEDLMLGPEGKAWKDTTQTLNNERIMNAAACVGMLDGVLEDALDYMGVRDAFGRKIGEFQALQHYVAEMAMKQKQAELLLYESAWRQSEGLTCAIEATMAKTVASEYACQAADKGISILGGMGYSAETDMQRYWRDARLMQIGPISNEMARNMIAQGLGLPRSF